MMTRGYITFVASLILGASTGQPLHAAPQTGGVPAQRVRIGKSANELSCRRAVQEFYDWYAPRLMREVHVTAMEQALRIRPRSFSAELRRGLAEDLAAAKKSPDEIVSLDFEPFVNSQDPASRYVVKRIVRVGRTYRAQVHSFIAGKPSETPDVVSELVFSGGRWVFVNFRYPSAGGKDPDTDLLKLLKELKAERRKSDRRGG